MTSLLQQCGIPPKHVGNVDLEEYPFTNNKKERKGKESNHKRKQFVFHQYNKQNSTQTHTLFTYVPYHNWQQTNQQFP